MLAAYGSDRGEPASRWTAGDPRRAPVRSEASDLSYAPRSVADMSPVPGVPSIRA